MLAVQYAKSIPGWAMVKGLGRWFPSVATSHLGLTRLREVAEPKLPGPKWLRIHTSLSGICGSDLSTITAEGSPFFSPVISFPFTYGHEVVGRIAELGSDVLGWAVGDRVVIEPALHCEVRGIVPICPACERGEHANCQNITKGDISAGVQTGYCRDTGGGWSKSFVVHQAQLHRVPDDVSDEAAVMIEPFCCSLHAVLKVASGPLSVAREAPLTTLVLGCGTIGLLTIAALRALEIPCRIHALAKYPHQQEMARQLGADEIVPVNRGVRDRLAKLSGASIHWPEIGGPTVLGGYDVVFSCVGSARALDDGVRFTRARGTTVLVGMPAFAPNLDWTSIWFKEVNVVGSYAYGQEQHQGKTINTFDLAMDLMRQRKVDLAAFVTHKYRLEQYKEAVATALNAGEHQSIKTVFDLRAS